MPPPPPDYSPEDIARRNRAAIAEVASMLPGNAEEASLAAQYVGAKRAAGARSAGGARRVGGRSAR
jgi:hypothetical protein